jgi:hypothetical protein
MSRKCLIKFCIAAAIFGALLIGRHATHSASPGGATAETWAAIENRR